MSTHPAVKRAQRNAKGTKKQMLEEQERRKQMADEKQKKTRVGRKNRKPMNPAAIMRNIKSSGISESRELSEPTGTRINRKKLLEQKNKPIPVAERKKINRRREETAPPRTRTKEPVRQNKNKPPLKGNVRVVDVEHVSEDLGEYVYVKKAPTAKELMEAKRQAALSKKQIDAETYEKIKKRRLRADRKARKADKKKVVKAKIVDTKRLKRRGQEGDNKKKYQYEFEEEVMDSWDSDIEINVCSVKEIDPREARRRIEKSMNTIGKRIDPSERIRVKKEDEERFTIEDLGNQPNDNKNKMPVVDIEDINKLINKKSANVARRDILLVGLSESAKDSIIDLIMDSKLGQRKGVFDTTLEENEHVDVPETAVAIFSEKVAILAGDMADSDEASSSEEGVQARKRAKAKAMLSAAERKKKEAADRRKRKQKLEEERQRRLEAEKRRGNNVEESTTVNKLVVKAEAESYEIEDFELRKDYPSVRLVFLTKVSANDRVDIHKLHSNVASFVPYERFKKKFRKLNRYEALVIDLNDKKQLYRIEFS